MLIRQLAIVTLRNFSRKLVGEQAVLWLLLHLQMLIIVVIEAWVHSRWIESFVHNWLFPGSDVRLLRLMLLLWVQIIKLHLGLMLLMLLRMEVLSLRHVHLLSSRV
jgi:hypothetical protein